MFVLLQDFTLRSFSLTPQYYAPPIKVPKVIRIYANPAMLIALNTLIAMVGIKTCFRMIVNSEITFVIPVFVDISFMLMFLIMNNDLQVIYLIT